MRNFSILRHGATIAALTAAATVTTLWAAPGEHARQFRKERHEKIAAQLNLTDTQREQIRSIVKETMPTVKPTVEQLANERRALRDLIHTTPVNEPAIRAQMNKIASIQGDLAIQKAKVAERISTTVLTPEQVAKAGELRKAAGDRAHDALERRLEKRGTL